MTSGSVNRTFIMLNMVSLISCVAETAIEVMMMRKPLAPAEVFSVSMLSYVYFITHHSTLVISVIFVFIFTRTDYQIRPLLSRIVLWAPIGVLVGLLFQNLFTHNVFSVTAEAGYTRGPMFIALYVIAALYGILGAGYSMYSRRYLSTEKWLSLLSVFLFMALAVLIQKMNPGMLVEMFATALSMLTIMMLAMRPELRMDGYVGIQSWATYQTDLKNLVLSGKRVQIIVIRMTNAEELRAFMGDDPYSAYVTVAANEIRSICRASSAHAELYFERPGTFYLTTSDLSDAAAETLARRLLEAGDRHAASRADGGLYFIPKVCVIHCPTDLSDAKDILNLGHKFASFGKPEQVLFLASEIIRSRNFDVENNIEDILNRAIQQNRLEMYYQPIYSIREKRFNSAEALVRLMDEQYGMISPGLFIPVAESLGLMVPIGRIVLESVYRFISEHDLEALGLSFIEINLSVAQCMQGDLPELIRGLEQKYGVSPSQVSFEITETMFDNLRSVVEKNLEALVNMGYSLSLDDYGTGYSNIQRLCRMPLSIVKIDKSLVDGMFTSQGRVIMQGTVNMMQSIEERIVVEGVETREAAEAVAEMNCDYIQGFYYARPMPADDFVRFLQNAPRGGVVA